MNEYLLQNQTNSNRADEGAPENEKDIDKEKKVESVIQKWLLLQKTIKEEITLEDVIIRHQQNEFDQLKQYFKQYYLHKLEGRKILEEIKLLGNNKPNKVKESIMERELEHVFLDICEPIKNLLFLFRNNYDYITTLVSLISEYDEEEKIASLVELFCNQFYENILIPNPEQEELLLLVYKLLEREISPMNSASIDEFLNDDTFLGKFITSFLKRQELKVFLSTLINPFILDIENNTADNYLGMSLFAIRDYLKEKNQNENDEKINIEDSMDFNDWNELEMILLKNIPKTSITFKKSKKKKKEKEEKDEQNKKNNENDEEDDEDDDSESEEENDEENVDLRKRSSNTELYNNYDINEDFECMLDLDYLDDKINQEKNNELREFYLYELEQITSDPDIYSNRGLLEIMKEDDFKDNRREIVIKYKANFLYLKSKIDNLIQSLINKIETIPYTVRCICKVISLLLQQKFPLLFNYLRNSFIGKFIFEKCIFPVLNLQNKNVLEPRILSSSTKKVLNDLISILRNANKCLLFNYNLDTEKTIFNHYLMEIIPILNKFYEKLIDIDLPPVLDDLVTKTKLNIEENIGNKIHNFRKKKKGPQPAIDNKKNKITLKSKEPLYNYFHEHSDEILHLQCICFSLDDILFILSLINRNIQAFSGLPDYIFFERTYEFIQPSDYKLDQENNKNPNQKKFFVIFKDEKNTNLEKFIKKSKKTNSTFSSDEQDSDLIYKRFKFCIKTVLKGLNLLNNKDYAHLNMANTTRKFFSALKYTLDDFGEFSEVKNKIPLKWYGQYIFNNKDGLDDKYKINDYSKLYDEIFNEEFNTLSELKSVISVIITRDGMNIRCAEKILQKAKYDLYHIKQAKEFVKIEKFVEEEELLVCFQTEEIVNYSEKESKKKKSNKNNKIKNKIPLLITDDLNTCIHKSLKYDNDPEKNEKLIPYHASSIKDFISKFSDHPWKEDEKGSKYVKPIVIACEDIKMGNRSNNIFQSLNMYMEIVKKHIKNPKKIKDLFDLNTDKINSIADKIKDYLMRQIYTHVYPEEQLVNDIIFYNKTKMLSWVTPENLDIKKLYINQLSNAVAWIKKIDVAKSIKDKLFCISSAYNTMNNTIKFSSGNSEEPGQDELTPIFQYIIIKARPKRMISNINYIKSFLDEKEFNGRNGFLLTQMESATDFILNITYKQLKVTEEEFEKNNYISKKKNY